MSHYFIMTIDVDPPLTYIPNYIIERGIVTLLNLLNTYRIKATFFVPSIVAEKFSALIKQVVKEKHEVGCHGLNHDPMETTASFNKQIRIIRQATETIQSIIDFRPIGFRAPLFKINSNCWKALVKNDYVYDSSIVCSPIYGRYSIFPKGPFLLHVKSDKNFHLMEIPVSINPLFPLPLGGTYFRILGVKWTKIGLKLNFMFDLPTVFYVHPKDIVARAFGRAWHSYRNTANCINALKELIEYAKQNGAQFLRADEFVEKFEAEFHD